MNKRPEKLISYKVYMDNNELIGLADVKLPSLDAMTESVKGAGIAGEVDSPTIGHFSAMSVTLNWVKVTGDTTRLALQKAHHLDLRIAGQQYDAAAGAYSVLPSRVTLKAIPKKIDFGKLDIGAKQDASWEGEVVYLKYFVDGKEKIELDKFNYIFKVDGVDQLESVRAALGMQ